MKRISFKYLIAVIALCLFAFPAFSHADDLWTGGWDYTNSDYFWVIESDGDLVPGTDSTVDIGSSSAAIANFYVDSITLGGVAKTSWGSVISPMTDASGYVNPTDAGNYVRLYDAGYIRLGDATNTGDYYVLFSSDTDSWLLGNDDGTDDFVICAGSTIGTDNRISIVDDLNTTTVTIGDGQAGYDKVLIFDGASTGDFYAGIDDTGGSAGEDTFVIGAGSAVNTTIGLAIDSTGLLYTSIGLDAIGAVDMDYGSVDVTDHTFLTDSTGDAEIVLPNDSIGDNEIDWNGLIADYNFEINGTTPALIIGDGDTEDNMVYFDGVTDFAVGVDHTRSRFEITNGANLDATCAISIDANEDVTLDSGSLYLIDDEEIYWGTNSDYEIKYDETTNDQLLLTTTATASAATGTPMVHIVVDDGGSGCTANQEVFGIARGSAGATDLLTLDEDGDLTIAGTATIAGLVTHSTTMTQTGVATFTAQPIFNGGVDINEDVDIDLDANDEEVDILNSSELGSAGDALVTIKCSDSDMGTQNYLLELTYTDDGDADGDFLVCKDANTTVKLKIEEEGNLTTEGTIDFNTGELATDDAYMVFETNSKTHKYHYYPIAYVGSTQARVGGGAEPLLCAGLAGVDEIGSTSGYVSLAEDADFLRFRFALPETFIDTGTQADLILQFYISEQVTSDAVTYDVNIYEFKTGTAILTDQITVNNGAAAGWVDLVTNAAGIGNEASLDADDVLVITISPQTACPENANHDGDFYGCRIKYKTGLEATQ